VGALLTWNTLGAVTGTLLTGFVLMPLAGLRHAFGGLALVLAGVGLLIAWRRGWRIGLAGSFITCMFVGSLFVVGDADWRNVMSSGIFRVWETRFEPRLMPIRKEHIKLLFYEDGPDATVSVEQTDGIIAPASIGLRINGKPDAGTSVDLCNQLLLAHLPLLVKPQAENVFVLGFGSGMTAGAALEYPNVHLDVAENCDSVLRAGKYFADWNRHVLSDPRATIWREDARTVLKLRPQMYDVMITEPSNPWTVGVGSVFSREFYELAARRLKPGGIIAQWFHLYETDDATVDLVLRTFGSVFPNMEIWDTGGGDLVILGSMQPWSTGAMAFARGFAINRVRTDLAMIDIHSPEALLARQLASQRTAFAIAGAGPLQSDFFPILEYHAPEAFFIGGRSSFLDRYDERTFRQLLAPPDKNHALRGLTLAAAQQVFRDFSSINGQLYGCLFGAPTSAEIPCGLPTPQPAPPPATTGSILNLCIAAIARGDLEQARQGVTYALQLEPDNLDAAYLKRVIDRHFRSNGAIKDATR
jgi:spermidine synthase